MKFLGTVVVAVCLALAATVIHARAQSGGPSWAWGRSEFRTMPGGMAGGIDPVRICKIATNPAARAKYCAMARQRVIQRKIRR
jgi:hypothetical protein